VSEVPGRTARRASLSLLVFNLATDADDPVLPFTTLWLRGLAQRVARIDVITMRAGRIDLPSNVHVFSLCKERRYSKPRRALRFYKLLGALLIRRRHDVCFAHQAPLFALMAAPLLGIRRIPIVLWYAHGATPGRLRAAEKVVKYVATSSSGAFRLPSRKVVVTGQGVDTSVYSPGTKPRSATQTLVCVGRIAPVKRLDETIDAVASLRREQHRIRLRLIGPVLDHDASYAQALRERVRRMGLAEVVSFVGPLPAAALVDEYRSATALVNTTSAGSFDKVVLEAMSCGTPAVCSSAAYTPILNAVDPRLAPEVGDTEALEESLRYVLSLKQDRRTELGLRLREIVERDHSLDRLMDLFVEDLFARAAQGIVGKKSRR
jgi:glycosyltransferase involved in cell wall biosynthesis